MPVTPTYPGVYIEELSSGVRTITGVATSITAFVGRALRGDTSKAVRIQSFAEFERSFGGLSLASTMSYAVQQYFLNGGTDAIIVRVVPAGAAKASLNLPGATGTLDLLAASEGTWANRLRARVDHDTRPLEQGEGANTLFNLTIKDMSGGSVEVFRNISTETQNRRYVTRVLEQESSLVRATAVPTERPNSQSAVAAGSDPFTPEPPTTNYAVTNQDGADGGDITDADVLGVQATKSGMYALQDADLFNLLCLPPLSREKDIAASTWAQALAYCKERRAMLIVDPPSGWRQTSSVENSATGVDSLNLRDENSALFFPRLSVSDPLRDNGLQEFPPCGIVAGLFARTDSQRGVWKAPAGQDATLTAVQGLSYKLTDGENGRLNTIGVNCFRSFPIIGHVLWGARTLEGADSLASEWKYVPVRRTALFLEESLYRGLKWVVFEPNDEPLWSQIRLNVGAFMNNLFRQGAFQGKTPQAAYFVKCDNETTTQTDINLGIVNILVGFAPLKPAEFVILKLQQMAGQILS